MTVTTAKRVQSNNCIHDYGVSFGQAKMAFSPLRHPFVSSCRLQSLLPTPRLPCQFGFRSTHLGAAAKVLDVVDRDRNLRHGNLPVTYESSKSLRRKLPSWCRSGRGWKLKAA